MLRKVLGVVAGIIVATLVFIGFERLRLIWYPYPTGYDPANHQAAARFEASLPALALLISLVGWIVGSVLCGATIRLIARGPARTPAYIAGLFLMTTGIVDIFMYAHPLWFIIAGIVCFIPAALLGHAMASR